MSQDDFLWALGLTLPQSLVLGTRSLAGVAGQAVALLNMTVSLLLTPVLLELAFRLDSGPEPLHAQGPSPAGKGSPEES